MIDLLTGELITEDQVRKYHKQMKPLREEFRIDIVLHRDVIARIPSENK
ncbi:MAG TPA: hypothetical protein VNJ08_12140 [Bacteriovoracaceae bacterium]|nr:hypothetical protein [Bacteriovoracaceae bacterium]